MIQSEAVMSERLSPKSQVTVIITYRLISRLLVWSTNVLKLIKIPQRNHKRGSQRSTFWLAPTVQVASVSFQSYRNPIAIALTSYEDNNANIVLFEDKIHFNRKCLSFFNLESDWYVSFCIKWRQCWPQWRCRRLPKIYCALHS